MIRAIEIANLRGIRKGSLQGFTDIVVLVGPNSAGKSTILEALFLGADHHPANAMNVIRERRVSLEVPHHWIVFAERNRPAGIVRILIKSDAREARITHVAHPGADRNNANFLYASAYSSSADRVGPVLQPNGSIQFFNNNASNPLPDVPKIKILESGKPSLPLHQLYSLAVNAGFSEQAHDIAAAIIPDFVKLEVLTPQGNPVLNLTFKDGPRPIHLVGDGIRMVIQQSLEFAGLLGGVVLMEEPEVHMHPAAIVQSAKTIWAASKRGLQIFLTTHSLDLIDSLVSEVAPESLDKLSIYRLQLSNGELSSSRYTGSEAATARTLVEEDLR